MKPTTPTTEPAPAAAPAAPTGAALQRAADIGSLGLSGVAALYVLLSIGAGLAFQPRQLPGGDVLHRIGFVAASAIDLRIGLTLVVAAVLGAAGMHLGGSSRSTARTAGFLTLVAAAFTAALAVLAVRVQYHQLDMRNTSPTTAFHLSQATYVVGSIGPAIIAGIVAAGPVLGLGRHR